MDDPKQIGPTGLHPPSSVEKPMRIGGWIAIILCLLLVLGPLLVMGFPREVARWMQAAADESVLDGDLESAENNIDKAINWGPENPILYLRRSEIRLQRNDLSGSLEDCERALALDGSGFGDGLMQRLLVYQRMGQHELALADADRMVEESANAGQRAVALNIRAYGRALANREPQKGLDDIQAAFEALATEDNAAFLDTRGYLLYLIGDFEQALVDVELAVQMAEDDRSSVAMQRQTLLEQGFDERLIDRQQKQMRESLAVLYQHRGLVYEALGRMEEANADFELAKEYGYNPEKGIW
ncbi:MAG: tetratricopeptide repeat protein [Planctomycetaceae bacterium]|nr:tetratricopeptide repeat protein [Planctomycetaceae bacterium]